ncbi:MAG TPA: tetratricopeptide repeat protein [Pyrinomonadaceae bacterium]|nr:tetratricopeptide repeat protein [Pyrinomonadaceae bacterium]
MSDLRGGVNLSGRGGFSRARLRLRIIRLRIALRRARRSQRVTHSSALGGVALFAACAGVVLGCGWDGYERSVRFNFYGSDRERQRLPPLPFKLSGDTAREPNADDDVSYREAERREVEADALWEQAAKAVERGQLERARSLLREYIERGDDTERMNSAADHLDALASLDRGSPAAHVRAYLDARRAYDTWRNETEKAAPRPWPMPTQAEIERDKAKQERRAAGMENWAADVEARLVVIERDRELADNAAYLRAVGIYRAGREGDALKAFESVAAKFPRSEKREAALFMAGKASMERSSAYIAGATATSEGACPECRDDAWRAARENFSRVVNDYPNGRLAGDARGWLAYLDWRVGERAGALVWYYRMLSDEKDAEANSEALMSLRLTRDLADAMDMERVEAALSSEPRVALTYAYHEIYNYTQSYHFNRPEITAGPDYPCDKYLSACESWREELRGRMEARAETEGLARVARFASRMLERYPGAQVGGAFMVRVAEADLELGDDRAALALARRALARGVVGAERAGALWVEGVAQYRLRDLAASRRTLAQLVKEFPSGDVSDGARRLLAMASEDAGDLDAALEQYLALRYYADVTYFVDVLLTPDQLASFVERHADVRERDVLLYSLGVRYLRAGRYAEARAALGRVHTLASDSSNYSARYGDNDEYDYYAGYYTRENPPPTPKYHLRSSFWDMYDHTYRADGKTDDGRATGVYADWILADLKTADDLERLEGEIGRAKGDEAKAEATYQLASYLYEGSNLLFYNPATWGGARATMIESLSESSYRAPNEAQVVWRYAQEHEAVARALAVYLDVVRRYPRTRAARDSLYTAILCHQELASFNAYWRDVYDRGLHAGERLVTLGDLRREYPNYRLPHAGDWKPSTRTVGGEPAWPAPPKARELTGAERVRLKLKRAERWVSQGWSLFGEVGGGRVRRWTLKALRWLVVALVASCLLLVFRLTRRTRRFLYQQLARRRASARAGKTYAPKSSYAAHLPYAFGASVRAASGEVAQRLFQLATHERGRAALALNLFTHGLLSVLLWAVLWAMK